MNFLKKIHDLFCPVYDITEKVVMFICKVLLVADILITTMSVLGRYVSFIPDPAWSEQAVLTLMTYMAVLSATIAIRHKSHIRMTSFDKYLPAVVIKILDVLADLAVMILGIIFIVYGMTATNNNAKFVYDSMQWLSKFWMYFPIPLAGIAMIIFELECLVEHLLAFGEKEVKEAK